MSIRYERLGEEVKKTLSEIIREMKDPRISDMTTVASVELTNDLKYAKVKVSVYDKDDVKEVAQGYECGIGLDRFNDIKVGDVLEAYIMEEVKR